MPQTTVGYLTSVYPALSHTFIFREIQALRARGLDIRTASISRPDYLDRMSPPEQKEYGSTQYIKRTPLTRVLFSHLWLASSCPKGYVRAFRYAVGLRRKGTVPLTKLLAYFVEMGPVLDWMRREAVRHLHIHFGNPAATVAMIAAQTGQATFSLTIHGSDIFYDEPGNLLAEKVDKALFVRCISHYSRCQVMRHTPFEQWPKLHIVRCGVDTSVFDMRALPENHVTEIVCVGRLIVAKGIFVLLQAGRALHEQGEKFHITLVGGGPEQAAIEAAATRLGIRELVTITGPVGQDAVHGYLNRADIMVQPSFAEGVPVVLMEAMAKGIVCISSRITGIPELIQDGVNGFLITPSDWEELAARMRQVIHDAALRAEFGRRARETVLAQYDIQKNARQLGELFVQYAASAP